MRRIATDNMYFLLVYVPASVLNGNRYIYPTWEQGYCADQTPDGNESRFGATAISGADLLSDRGRWKTRAKCKHIPNGHFKPAGNSFARILADLILCNRGKWREFDENSRSTWLTSGGPRVALTVAFEHGTLNDGWQQFLNELRAAHATLK